MLVFVFNAGCINKSTVWIISQVELMTTWCFLVKLTWLFTMTHCQISQEFCIIMSSMTWHLLQENMHNKGRLDFACTLMISFICLWTPYQWWGMLKRKYLRDVTISESHQMLTSSGIAMGSFSMFNHPIQAGSCGDKWFSGFGGLYGCKSNACQVEGFASGITCMHQSWCTYYDQMMQNKLR